MKDHREWWCSQWTINNCLLRAYFKCIHYISFIDFRCYDGHHLLFPSNFSFVWFLLNGHRFVRFGSLFFWFDSHLHGTETTTAACTFYVRNRVLWMPMDVDLMENVQHFQLVARSINEPNKMTKKKKAAPATTVQKSHHPNTSPMVIVWGLLVISARLSSTY